MKKIVLFFIMICMGSILTTHAQLFQTNEARIEFSATKSNIEPIEAKNKKAQVIFDRKTGEIASLIKIKGFVFPNSLMQEHFNENYMESDKYPQATFTGKLLNYTPTDENFSKEYTLKGTFKIHGVSREKSVAVILSNQKGQYRLKGNFIIGLKDFKIKIPKLMFYKIAETVNVILSCELSNKNK